MGIFILLAQLSVGLYLIIGAVAAFFVWRALAARNKSRSTYYELERDIARQKQYDSMTVVAGMGLCALMVLGIVNSVAPFVTLEIQQQELVSIGQVNLEDRPFATLTPPPQGGGLGIEPVPPLSNEGAVIVSTPAPTATPVGTLIPNAPLPEGCTDERASLTVPANGMRVFQPIEVIGTAYADSFSVAKLEIRGPGTNDAYAVIDDRRQETRQLSAFSQFAPSPYEPGEYQFRLMVFDLNNTPVASCMVTIYITDPPIPPTPTATPQP
jgi:hypothetical protein